MNFGRVVVPCFLRSDNFSSAGCRAQIFPHVFCKPCRGVWA
nr:MAG TPA: hypothetical protein [Caudoviricetes sp.]